MSGLYNKVMEIVVEAAWSGYLIAYFLENSKNIMRSEAKGAREAYGVRVLRLLEVAPPYLMQLC